MHFPVRFLPKKATSLRNPLDPPRIAPPVFGTWLKARAVLSSLFHMIPMYLRHRNVCRIPMFAGEIPCLLVKYVKPAGFLGEITTETSFFRCLVLAHCSRSTTATAACHSDLLRGCFGYSGPVRLNFTILEF